MTIREAGTSLHDDPVGSRFRDRETARATYRRLRMVGLTATEAGNLTAHLNGLHVVEHSWTLREIEHLLFVRALVDHRRISS